MSTPSTGSCSASFPAGTLVTLRATPPTGGTFVAWGGACGGNLLSCQVQLSQDQSVAATFNPAPAPTFAVTVAAGVNTRPGVVTSSPAGISCTIGPSGTAGTCVSRFVTGTQVTLHAQPTTGTDMLTTWGNENPCNNGVTADCTVTLLQSLTFAPVLVPSVEVRVVADSFPGNGKGTLSAVLGVGGPRITDFDCTYTAGVLSGKCATRVPLGAIVQISQTYGAGTVVGGVIDCTGGAFAWNVESGTCNVTASADRVVQVRYVQYLEYYFTAAMQVEGLSNGEPLPTPLPVVRCEPACGSFTPATARRSIPIAQGATSLTFTTVMDTAVWLPFSAVIGDATDCPDVPPNTIAGCVVPDRFFLLRFPNVMNYHQVFVPRSRSTKVVVEPFPGSSIRTVGPRFPRCAPSAVGGPRNACVAGLIDGGIAAYAQTGGTQWDPPCMLVTDSSFPGQQLCRVVFSGAGTTIVVRNKP